MIILSAFSEYVDDIISQIDNGDIMWDSRLFNTKITISEVTKTRDKLKKGKAAGWDNVSTEHLVFAGDALIWVVNLFLMPLLHHNIFLSTLIKA